MFPDCLTSISYVSALLPVFVLFVFNNPTSDLLGIPVLSLQLVKMAESLFSGTGDSPSPLPSPNSIGNNLASCVAI